MPDCEAAALTMAWPVDTDADAGALSTVTAMAASEANRRMTVAAEPTNVTTESLERMEPFRRRLDDDCLDCPTIVSGAPYQCDGGTKRHMSHSYEKVVTPSP
jgi:hypothetical protein